MILTEGQKQGVYVRATSGEPYETSFIRGSCDLRDDIDFRLRSGVTATCKDGTAFTGTSRSGACSGHGGVQAWGSVATGTPPSASTASPTTTPPTPAPTNS